MKKILLPLVILVAIVAAAVPSIFGLKAEDVYREQLAGFAIPGILKVEVLSYERGWLSSKAQVLIELEAGGAALLNPELKKLTTYLLQDTIYHGPFTLALGEFATLASPTLALAVVDSVLFFDDEPDLYRALFGEAPLFIARSTVDFSGGMHSIVYSQPMTAEIAELGATIDWKGFRLDSELAGQQFGYTVAGDGLTVKGEGIDFELYRWREEGQLTLHSGGPITGDVTGSMDGASASDGTSALLEFGGLTYEKASRLQGGLLAGEFSMKAAPVVVMGEAYGPTVLKAEVSNVAAAQLTTLVHSLNRSFAERPFTNQESQEEGGAGGLIEMLSESDALLLIEALRASPRFALSEFSFKTAKGDTTGRADVGFDGEGLPEKLSSEELVKRVYAEWNFQLPLELALKLVSSTPEVQQQAIGQLLAKNPNAFPSPRQIAALTRELAQALIDTFTQQGYILTAPQTLTISGSLRDATLTVGTQALPLGEEP
jgi:uncharacterized protein YdgA (DUF945 family)